MLKSKHKQPQRLMDLMVETFQLNYGLIAGYLSEEEHPQLKLICRGIYYLTISQELWMGLRLEVVDKKMELFEDLDFVDEEPKVISKQEKQIRIHSLKKNSNNIRIRQASNVKEKKVALNTIHNQLPFRSTEVGFKRLLRPTLPSKSKISSTKQISSTLLDLVEIPKELSARELVIDVKDAWSVNVQRAHTLAGIAKKWNQFHHRVVGEFKEVEKDLANLVKKCIRVDKNISDYIRLFQSQPYKTVRVMFDGAQQQLLIDDQLNKLGKLFVKNQKELCNLGQYLESFISKTDESCSKLNRHNNQSPSTLVVQNMSNIQELVEQWVKISKGCPQLIRYLSKSLLEIMDSLLSDLFSIELDLAPEPFPIFSISLHHISKRSDYFQILFESYQRVCGGLLRLCEGGQEQNMGLNLTVGKFKNLKTIAHHLCNISKYFSKLVKQLQNKQRKGSAGGKGAIIRNFLQSYDGRKVGASLLDWKYPNRAEKEVVQLKQRVGGLKGLMQGSD